MKEVIIFLFWTVATVLLSAAPFTVAIDPGHTPKHFGALSARGVKEYLFNKKIAEVLQRELQREPGIESFIVNWEGKEIGLKQRVAIAAVKRANLFLSLHHDSAQERYFSDWDYNGKKLRYSDKFSGYSIFVSHKNPYFDQSYSFAKHLGKSLLEAGMHPSLHHAEKIKGESRELLDDKLGIYRFDDLIVLKYAKMPAVLLECGVIVNRKEELKLASSQFRVKLAHAIIEALKEEKRIHDTKESTPKK